MTKVKYTMTESAETTYFVEGLSTPDLQKLKDKHRELIDIVDELTKDDMGKFVDLPQLVVVGDQSSGKSSVLESISRVRFPSDHNVCTRFATQLVLSEADAPLVEVTITPHEDASAAEKERIKTFRHTQEDFGDLSPIIAEATRVMGLEDNGELFSKHTLRVEASGPGMLRLTLVDLPGFYGGRSNTQSDKFREMPLQIAEQYIKRDNTIILMVVSADMDTTKQDATRVARDADIFGQRTLGIITKPDLIQKHSEPGYEALLRNARGSPMYLKYGWHVVRNRASDEPLDFEARDRKEAEDLSKKVWKKVNNQDKGIKALRTKLSNVLIEHVTDKLPHVTETLRELRRTKEEQHQRFEDRSDFKAIQSHLNRVQQRFSSLASQAVRGQLEDSRFFAQPTSATPDDESVLKRNLRARIRRDNKEFVKVMQLCGSRHVYDWRTEGSVSRYLSKVQFSPEQLEIIRKYGAKHPEILSQDQLEEEIKVKADLFKGMELPGSFHQGLSLKIFKDEAQPWESLARVYINQTIQVVETLIRDILQYATDNDKLLFERINAMFIAPFIEDKRKVLAEKVKEFVPLDNQHSFAIALEDDFEEKVKSRGFERVRTQVQLFKQIEAEAMSEGLSKALMDQHYAQAVANAHQGTIRGSEIPHVIENMVEYYEMTLNTFVTNIITLGVENQLMVKIPEVFTMDGIFGLDDQTVKWIGEEAIDTRQKRVTLHEELEQLKRGIDICERWQTGSTTDIPVRPNSNSTAEKKE